MLAESNGRGLSNFWRGNECTGRPGRKVVLPNPHFLSPVNHLNTCFYLNEYLPEKAASDRNTLAWAAQARSWLLLWSNNPAEVQGSAWMVLFILLSYEGASITMVLYHHADWENRNTINHLSQLYLPLLAQWRGSSRHQMWRCWNRQSGLMRGGTGLGCWQLSSPSGHTTCPENLPRAGGHRQHRRAASVAAGAGSSLPADAASAAAGGHSMIKGLSEDLAVRSCKGTLQLLGSYF